MSYGASVCITSAMQNHTKLGENSQERRLAISAAVRCKPTWLRLLDAPAGFWRSTQSGTPPNKP
jgi:hypothetical protein